MTLGSVRRLLFEGTLAQLSQCCMLALVRRINKTGKAESPSSAPPQCLSNSTAGRGLSPTEHNTERNTFSFLVAGSVLGGKALGQALPPEQSCQPAGARAGSVGKGCTQKHYLGEHGSRKSLKYC